MLENEITGIILDAAHAIHIRFGPGLFETVYETLLAYELSKRHLRIARQVPIPLRYDALFIPEAFRADLLVEDLVLVEFNEPILRVKRIANGL